MVGTRGMFVVRSQLAVPYTVIITIASRGGLA